MKNTIIIPKYSRKNMNLLIDSSKEILIVLEENAELNLVTNLINAKKDAEISFEIDLMENSKLNYLNMQNFPLIAHLNNKIIKLEKNSVFNYYELNFGSKSTYSQAIVNLNGENAKFEHYGLFLTNKDQKFDLGLDVIHNSPNTYSNILSKGALNDSSKVNCRGLIKISKNASNSNGYQKQDAILLSDNAEANSIPKLEIDNNDVRCTHGATVSQVEEDKLFYLMSRGLDEKEAKSEIVKGFLEVVLNKIKLDNLEEIKELINEKIK